MRINFILSIVTLFLFTACKKEKSYDECDTLSEKYVDISNDLPGQSYTIYDSLQFFYASINPNNHNEVVYQGGKTPNWYVCTYNVITKQHTKLTQLYPTHNLKWHKSNWITFAASDNNIYVIKSNGDSITQLTTTGNCFTPEWNGTGDKIICFMGFQNSLEGNNYIINKDGSGIATVNLYDSGIGICSWSQDDSAIVHATWQDLSITNWYNGNTEKVLYNETLKDGIKGVCWLPDKRHILWCPDGKPELMDIKTGDTRALLPYCEKRFYGFPSVTADGRYALFNLNIGGYVAKNTTQTKRRLSVIDLTTNTETILDLPE